MKNLFLFTNKGNPIKKITFFNLEVNQIRIQIPEISTILNSLSYLSVLLSFGIFYLVQFVIGSQLTIVIVIFMEDVQSGVLQ